MDKIAFVFAGQGAQAPGMGRDLYENFAPAQEAFDRAEALRPGTLKQCFEGPADELTQTVNAQPCLFLADYACALAARDAAGQPAFSAGFSLGEMAAAAFSGLLPFEDAFRMVMKRAALMQACAEKNPGAMFAVVKLPAEKVVLEPLRRAINNRPYIYKLATSKQHQSACSDLRMKSSWVLGFRVTK
jgi:[acyl-carrier-protein] S-malonyltransferase